MVNEIQGYAVDRHRPSTDITIALRSRPPAKMKRSRNFTPPPPLQLTLPHLSWKNKKADVLPISSGKMMENQNIIYDVGMVEFLQKKRKSLLGQLRVDYCCQQGRMEKAKVRGYEPTAVQEATRLESRFFPSKVGGKPAWLDLKHIPDDLKCKECGKPCVFLCQVYAPIEDVESCFHRTIFIFICRDPVCCKENSSVNFKVFRCQLKRRNNYYSFNPPIEKATWQPDVRAEHFLKLCAVCGARGQSHCGKCRKVNYCGREHQTLDWKAGHRNICASDKASDRVVPQWLLPEFELTTQPEDYESEETQEDNESNTSEETQAEDEETQLREYKRLVVNTSPDVSTASDTVSVRTYQGVDLFVTGDSSMDQHLLNMAGSEGDDDFFHYNSRMKQNPGHVLRYDRGGEPLWVSGAHVVEVPSCPNCGAPRVFEFQASDLVTEDRTSVLSTLLNHLSLDTVEKSVDWGTLLVYTCEDSCDDGPIYKEEFIYKQDISTVPSAVGSALQAEEL
uniref:MYND-type domain-containing protein n=1 Tax=Timema monikensis TaxID=170555 RepID=A0A7R9E8E8_9NEOP|nr:unnamed protein product [Timema monikensis]